jgi:CRISPR-associated protein Cas2
MWMVVMFDLPVVEKKERKAATEFRNALLDLGFEMSQFSVYMRFCTSPAQVENYCKKVESALPVAVKSPFCNSPTSSTNASSAFTVKANNLQIKRPINLTFFS